MTAILVVLGSATPPGRLDGALQAGVAAAREDGLDAGLVSLADAPLEYAGVTRLEDSSAATREFVAAVQGASAIVFASPVYRASLTGVLKNALDLLPVESLRGKPTGIVAMGATDHHYLGVESHLRDILSWFGALIAPTSVYLTSADFADGEPQPGAIANVTSLLRTLCGLSAALAPDAGVELGPEPLAARRSR